MLTIVNGSGLSGAADTWIFRSILGVLRRIDYILYSAGLSCDGGVATSDLDLGSDHRSVKAPFQFMPGYKTKRKKVCMRRGWKPIFNEDGIAEDFHKNIDDQMQRECHTLADVQSILRDAASVTKSSDEVPNGGRPEKSMALKTLIYQRRHSSDNSERKRLSKAIYKMSRQELRKWRTIWADHLLHKFRNTKHLQKINIDPIKSRACPFLMILSLIF